MLPADLRTDPTGNQGVADERSSREVLRTMYDLATQAPSTASASWLGIARS